MDYRQAREPVRVPNAMAALSNAFAADGERRLMRARRRNERARMFVDDLSSAVFSQATQEQANSYFQVGIFSSI